MLDLDSSFLKAIVSDKTFILGYELRPFSLGHSLLLQRLDSPLATNRDISYIDFLEALFVCRNTFEYSIEILNSKRARAEHLKPHRHRSWFGLRSVKWKDSLIILREHIAKGLAAPVTIPKGDVKGDPLETPAACMLVINLMKSLKMSFSEVINQHLALSYWLYTGLAEQQGGIIITSKEQQEADQKVTDEVLAAVRSGKMKIPGYDPETNGAK